MLNINNNAISAQANIIKNLKQQGKSNKDPEVKNAVARLLELRRNANHGNN